MLRQHVYNAFTVLLVALALTVGCHGRGKTVVRQYQPPKAPPLPPPARNVPLDQSLRSRARQEILSAFASRDAIVRAHAVEAMQDTLGGEFAPQITAALGDRDPVVRFAGSIAAGRLGLADATPTLLNLASDPDASVRIGAKFALHKLGDTRFSHDFEQTYKDPVKRTRGDTALVLGLLAEPSANKILIPMLRDRDYTVRIQAAEALWRLRDERGLEPLISATISRYPDDQMIALLALAQPKDHRAEQNFRGALTSDYDEVALVAARCLGMLGSDEGYTVAQKGARSADARQRFLAALAFGAIARPDAQDALEKLLKDPTADVRLAAATAILQLHPVSVVPR
ncbi:MAG TPA: HEAT repeat domain-containing protein [Tepidisphaeraceae bacterium]|jgi:HEAT repeat protein